ncbi:MAG TPA: hypothetical protein PLO29_06145 [Paludibacter sp.]|jgi:hypothetical protein|nr:hypothetical protein [Smithella sp.]HQB28513.1 hypothetical protein [Paludibacter sp.]
MDHIQATKQMMELNKTAFDNTFKIMTLLQDQAENYVFRFMEKATWIPLENRKVISEWLDTYKNGRVNFKDYCDETYKKAIDYFTNKQTQETYKDKKKV